MGRSVSIKPFPGPVVRSARARARPRICVLVDLERGGPGSDDLIPLITGTAAGLGLPEPQAQRLAAGARALVHYLAGHGRGDVLRVRLEACEAGIDVDATDALDGAVGCGPPGPGDARTDGAEPAGGPLDPPGDDPAPIWLRVPGAHPDDLPADRTPADPVAERRAKPGRMLLYGNGNGRLSVGFHTPWPAPRAAD